MQYQHIQVPADGEAITANRDHSLNVPDRPVIPFIEGDGIGVDVTPVMRDVVNAAVKLAYGKAREIEWMQVYAGQAAADLYGGDQYLPDETLHALTNYIVSDTDRRWHPITQRSHSADAGPVCLCSSDSVFSGCIDADEAV